MVSFSTVGNAGADELGIDSAASFSSTLLLFLLVQHSSRIPYWIGFNNAPVAKLVGQKRKIANAPELIIPTIKVARYSTILL